MHVNDYFDRALNTKEIENFDNAASYSSIEHSGLGRFGDPLSPNGDQEAVKQVHCMLKPGGLFFLGLPVTADGRNHLEFNAGRTYGKSRLKFLFGDDWKLLAKKNISDTIFVLQKIQRNKLY